MALQERNLGLRRSVPRQDHRSNPLLAELSDGLLAARQDGRPVDAARRAVQQRVAHPTTLEHVGAGDLAPEQVDDFTVADKFIKCDRALQLVALALYGPLADERLVWLVVIFAFVEHPTSETSHRLAAVAAKERFPYTHHTLPRAPAVRRSGPICPRTAC